MRSSIPGILGLLFAAVILAGCEEETAQISDKHVTELTQQINQKVLEQLPFDNRQDFEDATKGLIARNETLHIKNSNGETIWHPADYAFVKGDAPSSVNPSLWRQAKLNNLHGLFRVTDGIYQVRGFDLSNMTLIEGETGWIIVDPLTTKETANAALEFAFTHLKSKPISALLMTHSHVDHFGGALAVMDKAGDIPVIAPAGFMEEATSENVLAGPTMARRAGYMYGRDLEKSAYGHVDTGLGKAPAFGTIGIVEPTLLIDRTNSSKTIDGVEFIFQYTPDSEAPAEFTFYLPEFKAFCGAELLSRNMHNLYTLRGAKVRDALGWSNYIEEARQLFSEADIYFASHHWPMWGQERIDAFLRGHRDIYKYIHDQTLRLAYKGYTPVEIANMVKLPKSLASVFSNRGYYGTVSHNIRAVYQFYFGWFDGIPANLNPLPPEERAKKYVEAMGGSGAVLKLAEAAFSEGNYRWSSEILNHLIFSGNGNNEARSLLARSYQQLGFQAESGPWRDVYLSGANELLNGKTENMLKLASAKDMLMHTPVQKFFDAMSAQLNGPDAEDKNLSVSVHFTDLSSHYLLWIENAVLHHRKLEKPAETANASIQISQELFVDLIIGLANIKDLATSEALSIDGSLLDLISFFSLLDKNKEPFNIVEP